MTEKRVTVWVQRFKDRPHLVLQWFDPDTGRRKSQSAGTADLKVAEQRRTDLEADLNHGRHRERGKLTWEKFRELFEAEFLPSRRPGTRKLYHKTLDTLSGFAIPSAWAW